MAEDKDMLDIFKDMIRDGKAWLVSVEEFHTHPFECGETDACPKLEMVIHNLCNLESCPDCPHADEYVIQIATRHPEEYPYHAVMAKVWTTQERAMAFEKSIEDMEKEAVR